MKTQIRNKRGPAAIFSLCPAAHILCLIFASVIALHLYLRGNHALMQTISQGYILPFAQLLARLCAGLGTVSAAEVLIGIFVSALLLYIAYELLMLIRHPGKCARLYRTLIRLACTGLGIYAGFCILWGSYYYGDDFISASGLSKSEISLEQLETVTVFFADRLNHYSDLVERGEDGCYTVDRKQLLEESDKVFSGLEAQFPCLRGCALKAKGIHFSRVMSYLDFTGFYFPFTGEANVNTDFPPALFASTIAHELSHQRSVAKEQEANFTAVLACLDYGDPDYCYSACMLAYIHLSNALRSADYDAWLRIYRGLKPEIINDFERSRSYWAQFETPVQTVSNTVYEGFLESYSQSLGLRSYGACVDLLVNYYYDEALGYFGLN